MLLAACSAQGEPQSYDSDAAQEGAEFREIAYDVIATLDSPCPITTDTELQETYAAPRSRLANLEARLGGGNHGVDLAIAQADWDHWLSQNVLECVEPDLPSAEVRLTRDLEAAMEGIIRLEQLAAANG